MRIELDMPQGLEEQIKTIILSATKEAINQNKKQMIAKDWMSITEACEYTGVSKNTFFKFRQLGLKVCEIDSVKRVSKIEIDDFFKKNSY